MMTALRNHSPIVAMTSVRGIGALPKVLERQGDRFITEHVFAETRLPVELLHEPQRMLPLTDLMALYEAAAQMTDDPLFGWNVGQEMIDGYGTWVDYARRAKTLRGCLERAGGVISYHQSGTELSLSVEGTRAYCSYHTGTGAGVKRLHYLLHTLPALLASIRLYVGEDWTPDWIELDVPRTPAVDALERATGIPMRCQRPGMAVVFAADLLVRRRCSAGLSKKALRSMVRQSPPQDISGLTREMIHLGILSGKADMDWVANRLNLGTRSLQRRLTQEGKGTYRDLVTSVRLERSKALLATTDLTVTEIALRAGYSESAHFARAFRNGQGMSPRDYRRSSAR